MASLRPALPPEPTPIDAPRTPLDTPAQEVINTPIAAKA
jgi:hypothetical protein